MADRIGGYRGGFARKMEAAAWVRALGLPLTLNVGGAPAEPRTSSTRRSRWPRARRPAASRSRTCSSTAGRRQPRRADAHAGAGDARRRETVAAARRGCAGARHRLRARRPSRRAPKPCMGGWGSTGLNVTPEGRVLPCHAAETIPGLGVRDGARAAARGDLGGRARRSTPSAAPTGCRSPAGLRARGVDFGGCRCQAMALAGDAAATDPVCVKSPLHAGSRRWRMASPTATTTR